MGVDPPEATSVQPLGLNKMEDFILFRDSALWEARQETEDLPPVPEVATRQLSDYKRMAKRFLVTEKRLQTGIAPAEVLDPHGGVNENHAAWLERRRRTDRRAFSVPPRSARRRALSLAMRASSPRRTREVFSLTPVSWDARWRRESSIFSVVLICITMPQKCISVKIKCRPDAAGWSQGSGTYFQPAGGVRRAAYAPQIVRATPIRDPTIPTALETNATQFRRGPVGWNPFTPAIPRISTARVKA